MSKPVTIVITPRDRYSDLDRCLLDLYTHTDEALFDLIVLDLGYPASDMAPAKRIMAGKTNCRLLDYGRIIPMEAMRRVSNEIHTRWAVFMDNDSRAFEPWLPQLLESAERQQAAVISPVTLERAGVDAGADVRCHLFTTELRYVDVDATPYLIEHKTFRRALPEELPKELTETQAFELHCVMFDTAVLQSLELPQMTIREHLDIGMQLAARNRKLWVEPRSRIMFDNLGTPARFSDLDYFNLRWNSRITQQSSRLFEKRWGYRFYSEEAMYHWASRRRLFLLLRWLRLPIKLANLGDRLYSALVRRLAPVWDPLKDPYTPSRSLYAHFPNRQPVQKEHVIE